jgi:hypothetical protein
LPSYTPRHWVARVPRGCHSPYPLFWAPEGLPIIIPSDAYKFDTESVVKYTVAYLLRARIVDPADTAVAKERLCKQTRVSEQWLGDRHVIAATFAHPTIAEMLEALFSVPSVPKLYVSW